MHCGILTRPPLVLNKVRKINFQQFPTAILFEVIRCLLPDDSQINIYVHGLYISVFSFLFITCQETPVKLATASIIFLYIKRFHNNGNIRINCGTKILGLASVH